MRLRPSNHPPTPHGHRNSDSLQTLLGGLKGQQDHLSERGGSPVGKCPHSIMFVPCHQIRCLLDEQRHQKGET